ncbi:MAG: SH3 domain-containing protein [Balneolaceae bacterium]|nr:SH3 domain-containing protein [Balneolaceae bacterium]
MGSTDRIPHALNRLGLLLLLLLAVPASTLLRAQVNPQLQFDKANDRLDEGNYIDALSIYRSLEEQHRVSGPLFLNMGICYVQLDSLGKAKYYFLKAERYEETASQAEEGLQYVESRFSRQSAVLPKLPWERFFDWLGNRIGAARLLGFGILLLNLGVAGFIATWFIPNLDRKIGIGGIASGAAGLLIIFSSFYVQYLQNRYSRAVMIHQRTNVMERPTSEAAVVSQAYEGYTFTVDHHRSAEEAGWYYVRMSNGLYGWIPDEEIMVL